MARGKTAPPTKRRRRGKRPDKLSPESLQLVLNALRTAVPLEDAAWLGGISPRTANRWKLDGEKDDELSRDTPERRFWLAVSKAAAEGRALLAGRAFRASQWDGNIALKILERRDPRNWSAKQEAEAPPPAPPLSPRQSLAARLDAIEKRMEQAQRAGVNVPE